MAIKIQGGIIIDDSKNIYTETGFYSDANNSAIRPKSSAGGSYLQRWTGAAWDTLLLANNTAINCYRDVIVASGYRFIGNGSGLTNLPTPVFPYNYYYDATNTAVRANGTTFIQNGAGNATYAAFTLGTNYLYQNTSISGTLYTGGTLTSNSDISLSGELNFSNPSDKYVDFYTNNGNAARLRLVDGNNNYHNAIEMVRGGSVVLFHNSNAKIYSTDYGMYVAGNANINDSAIVIGSDGTHSFLELRKGNYPYIDFGAATYGDYGVRLAGSGENLIIRPVNDTFVYGVNTGADAGTRVLRLNDNNRLLKVTIGSSRRYKTNIKNLTSEWFDKVYDIVPVSFNYKEHCVEDNDLMGKGNCFKIGVIAEDVAESTPEFVQFGYHEDQYIDNPDPEDPIKKVLKENPERTPVTVNYESIFMCAVGALQQLRQRVVDLEEELQSLKQSLGTP